MQLDEPIHIADYDPAWPVLFAQESLALQPIFAPTTVVFEHIGSTAVPGMAAKPIVDMLAGLPTLALSAGQLSESQQHGYDFLGEAGVPGRLYLRKRTPH